MVKIETGVDKLVELVNDKKKLTIDEAAKELGVSNTVVQEWADFLEEEGLVGIEYSLSKTYLVEKKLSKNEAEKKGQEYGQKKETFVRKIDTALRQLEKDTSGFEDIKKAYNSLKGDIGDEIDQVKQELDELKHYESLKQSIDQDIIQQKIDYQKMINDVQRKLYAEEKRYEKIMTEIKQETAHVDKEQEQLKSIEQQEESLKKRLSALQDVIKSIDAEVGTLTKSISSEQDRITRLRDISQTIIEGVEKKKKNELDPLLEASKEHGEKIIKVQESIIKKVQSRSNTIKTYEKEGQDVIDKFDAFFKKRMEMEKMLSDLERQKAEMAHELDGLKQKATAFNLLSGNSDVKKHMQELDTQFKSYDKKKGVFASQLEKLRSFIGGKEKPADK